MSVEAPRLISKSRLEALTDGVFAVVMTILFIQDVNETQLWLNLLFLFFLSFIPFAPEPCFTG